MSDLPECHNSKPARKLTLSDLAQFSGSETFYRHSLVRKVIYTEGVQYVAEAGEAYWLIDKIACAQLEPRHAEQEFQVWDLKVKEDRSAVLVCTDGNENTVSTEQISFTDFPLIEIRFFLSNNTIMLPGEY